MTKCEEIVARWQGNKKRPKGEDLLTENELNETVGGYVPTHEQMEGDK